MSYSSDPILHFLVFSWECLEISTSFSINWITFYHVTLDYSFHSMSLACIFFSLGLLSLSLGFGASSQLVVFCLVFWDMFIDDDHLFTPYTYHGLNAPFFVWSLIQFSTRCSLFHYKKVKDTFSHLHFFREIRLDHLIIFSLHEARVKD